jgi:hypothetical protein
MIRISFTLCAFATLLLFTVACKKDVIYHSDNTATVMVVNGLITSPTLSLLLSTNGKLNTSGIAATGNVAKVDFGLGALFFAPKGMTDLGLLKATDSSTLTLGTYDLNDNTIYSLLVTGPLPTIETLLIKEANYPFIRQDIVTTAADSVINVRFINLSPNTSPLDIRIQGSTSNEATGLGYKAYTAFKAYPAKTVNPTYVFQVVENGTVLTSFTLSITGTNRFKNVAVLVRGLKGGTPALGVSAVNYF